MLINKESIKLEKDTKYAFFLKFTKLVKKSSNLIKIGKEKPHWLRHPISHFFAHFDELVGRSCFCLVEGLTDNLAIDRKESRGGKVVVDFSR